MAAKYILVIVAVLLLTAGAARALWDGGRLGVASKTWLFMGTAFMLIALWLWLRA